MAIAGGFLVWVLIALEFLCLAPGPGFEPGLEASKAPVLPLNDPGTRLLSISDISSPGGVLMVLLLPK